MIPILLIHDPLRKDRRDLFTRELDSQGIEGWELVPAVKDAGTATENIAAAHKNCIRKAQEKGWDKVVIMEDDVMFVAPGAYNRFLDLSTTLPDDWHMFISGSYESTKKGHPKGDIVRVYPFSGLHCYMVNSKFYKKYLDTPQLKKNIDKSLVGNFYLAMPMLALQYDTFSDNVGRLTTYNKNLERRKDLWQKEA